MKFIVRKTARYWQFQIPGNGPDNFAMVHLNDYRKRTLNAEYVAAAKLFEAAPELARALQLAARDLGISDDEWGSRRGQTADAVRAALKLAGVPFTSWSAP